MTDTTNEARQASSRLRRRALPLALLAALAFGVGIVVASGGDDGGDAVRAYAKAWSAGDWAAMRAQLTESSQQQIGLLPFANAGRSALATATAGERSVTTGTPESAGDDRWRVPVSVRTRIFGTVKGEVVIPVVEDGDVKRIDWQPRLVFPGPARRRAAHTQDHAARARHAGGTRRHDARRGRGPDLGRSRTSPARSSGALGPGRSRRTSRG